MPITSRTAPRPWYVSPVPPTPTCIPRSRPGINALSGPLHGGANEAVLRQLKAIRDSGKTVKEFVEDAKRPAGQRISGLGHRVY